MTRPKLLVVENREEICLWLRQNLRKQYDLIEVPSGAQAFIVLKKKKFNLILLSNQLGDISGIHLCQKLRQEDLSEEIPILMYSDLPASELIKEAFDAGINEFIQTPFQTAELFIRIHKLLERKTRLDQKDQDYLSLKKQSEIDPLTSIYNRRALNENALREVEKVRRNFGELVFLMIDIDKFKYVNDHYGHFVGDEILIKVADLLKRALRKYDIVGRYGGDEFIVILPHASVEQGRIVADKVWHHAANYPFDTSKGLIKVTLSVGVLPVEAQTLKEGEFSLKDFLVQADQAMYKAKTGGRNQVYVAVVESQL